MIDNLASYFKEKHEIFLDSIKYNIVEENQVSQEYQLNGVDSIETKIEDEQVRVVVKRALKFYPEAFFSLEVAFGAVLEFNDEKKSEQDWQNVNLAEEFRENGGFILDHLLSRISLLIAQITSSYGQQPLILKPEIAPK